MDDLSATISSILSDPQKMEQLRAVAQSLGVNPDAPPPSSAPPPAAPQGNPAPANPSSFDPATIASLFQGLSGMSGGQQPASPQGAPAAGGMPDLSQLSKLAGLFGTFNQSDKNVDLLRSLRPHFSTTRAGKIDDAVRIMQIIRMWPTLRDSGLLGSLGNLFGGGGK